MPTSSFQNDRLIIATHNSGKLHEFKVLLGDFFHDIVSAGELGLPEPDETGITFEANARLKAVAAREATHHSALSDDSGLCVHALGGDPGIYSARWAGPLKDFPAAMKRIHDALSPEGDHRAYFIAVLCLATSDGETEFFEGRCHGTLIWPPRGTNGHGYDPIFVPEGSTRTFAEMTDSEKNTFSHRAQAIQKLIARLRHS